MDQVIKSIITNRLSNIEHIIRFNEIDDVEYHKIYHYFFYFYTQSKISDKIMYLLTYLLIGKYKIIHIHHIYDFKNIMVWHISNKKNANKTFMTLNIYNNIHVLRHKIKWTLHFLKSNSTNVNKLIGNHKKTSTIKKIIKRHFIDYMTYFDDDDLSLLSLHLGVKK